MPRGHGMLSRRHLIALLASALPATAAGEAAAGSAQTARSTAPGKAVSATPDDVETDFAPGDNLFPNSQWQLLTALPPGWDGDPGSLAAHQAAFEVEENWLCSGPILDIPVSRLAISIAAASGQITVIAQSEAPVHHLYPGAIIVFFPGADASLTVSPMRVRTVNYAARTFTFYPPRNAEPKVGDVHCTCRQVMRCDRKGVTGHGPDGWSKTTSAHLWIDRWPEIPSVATAEMAFAPDAVSPYRPAWTCNLRPSMKRCVVFAPQSDGGAHFYHSVPDHRHMRGRTMVFGMWVRGVSGGVGRLFVNDGAVTQSAGISAPPDWAWLEMCHTVSPTAGSLAFGFLAQDSAGHPWRIAEPRLDFGRRLGRGAYVRPKGRIERFVVKITPDSYFGADFAFGPTENSGAIIDFAGETALAIAEDVPLVYGQIEGTPGRSNQPLFSRSQFLPPHRYGAEMHASTGNVSTATSAVFDLHSDGTMWLYSTPGAAWRDVSIDLNQAILW